MTETEIWTKWESQVVNGAFPLRRYLGRSDHSVVFLTEDSSRNLANAAIKIVPADPVRAEAQLAQWRMIAALSHPHLIQVLNMGSCTLGGHPFLYVVMEYAEQTLAQILPQRPLSFDEVKQILPSTLEPLAYLHANNLVHGQLKPPNFLVVNDQLKLSSDSIRRPGESAPAFAKPGPYDAPEAKNGRVFAAGDVWSLGATLSEALTQVPPSADQQAADTALPAELPADFAGSLRACLSRNPIDRPTIANLTGQLGIDQHLSAATAPAVVATAEPMVRESRPRPTSVGAQRLPKPRWLIAAGALSLIGIVAIWAGVGHRKSPPAASAAQNLAQPGSLSTGVPTAIPAPTPAPNTMLHQEIPDISRRARDSIHGHIKVVVRVSVDRSGNVVAESLESRGSSRYFARLATDAAKKWKFAPSEDATNRKWLLQFEFSREGVTGNALNERGRGPS
jgi:serine/threonine protein kinase